MADKKKFTLLILFLFAALFLVRLIHLSADPPYNLSASGGPWGDPAGYSQNARAKVLFGTWKIDAYNMMYSSFPPHLVTYAIFKMFGVGLAQQNLVPVLFSLGALAVFFVLLRLTYGSTTAGLGTLLLGFNYLFLMFSRIADRVMPPLFFLLLGILFLIKGKKRLLWIPAAGVSFLLALISKSVIFYALGAVLTGYFFHLIFNEKFKDTVRNLILLLAGALLVLVPWYFFLFMPSREFTSAFAQLNIKYLIPPMNASLLLRYFWIRPPILFKAMPVLAAAAAMFSLTVLFRMTRLPKTVKMTEWIFGMWFATGYMYYALIQQRVTRHFIPQIVPLVFFGAALVGKLLKKKGEQENRGQEKNSGGISASVFFGLSFIWMLFPVSLLIKFSAVHFPRLFPTHLGQNIILLTSAAILSSLLVRLAGFWVMRPPAFPDGLKMSAAGFLVVGMIVFQAVPYVRWAAHPPYQIRDISSDFGKAFEKAVFAGLWAPAISLENRHRAHEYFRGYVNPFPDFFERFGVTHVFTTTAFRENLIFREDFPHAMAGARLLARYHIWTTQALLYDIHPTGSAENGIFEAELYTSPGAVPRYDADASGGFAVRFAGAGTAAEIPLSDSLDEGTYHLAVRLKGGGTKKAGRSVVRLEALSLSSRRVLARIELEGAEIPGDSYKEYILSVVLKRARDIALRARIDGGGEVWLDCVELRFPYAESH